jgi:hypothetical protein
VITFLDPGKQPVAEITTDDTNLTKSGGGGGGGGGGGLPPPPADTFIDDDDSPFEEDIEWLFANDITKGCNAAGDRFCPLDSVTRGEMAAFLVRALGLIAQDDGNVFTDDDGSIFEDDIEKLAFAGITKGCGPGLYCPNDFVTRAEMAAFLVRALELSGQSAGNVFTDDDGSIFEDDIEKLAFSGITKGCGPGIYCPNDDVERGQMAAFLHRALG